MTYHIIKKSFGTEFCTWPDEIGLCVTDDLRSKTISAEYDFTHLIPHPIVADLEEESAAHDTEILEELGTQSPDALYEVQTLTASDGWLNTWSVLDENDTSVPQTFTSRKAAQKEIDEHVSDIQEAIENGDLDVMLEEFRIVPLSKD